MEKTMPEGDDTKNLPLIGKILFGRFRLSLNDTRFWGLWRFQLLSIGLFKMFVWRFSPSRE